MKAIVKTSRAPGAAYRDLDIPTPARDEILIRVTSASISPEDLTLYNWTDPSFPEQKTPFVFGQEFCGEVVEVGALAKGFQKDDFVSVESHIFCGVCGQCRNDLRHVCQELKVIGRDVPGGFSEYAVIPARCAWKHSDDSLKDIAPIMAPFGTSVHAVLSDDILGKTVIILGCQPQGLFATAIAKAGGARTIIALDESPFRRKLATKVGATCALDVSLKTTYLKVMKMCGNEGADAVFEMTGLPESVDLGLKMLHPHGRFVACGIPTEKLKIDLAGDIVRRAIHLDGVTGREIFRSWYKTESLLKSGAVNPRPVITHTFKFKDFVKAFTMLNKKDKKCGKIILVP